MPATDTLLTVSIILLSDSGLTVAAGEQCLPTRAATMHLVVKGICWVREELGWPIE